MQEMRGVGGDAERQESESCHAQSLIGLLGLIDIERFTLVWTNRYYSYCICRTLPGAKIAFAHEPVIAK